MRIPIPAVSWRLAIFPPTVKVYQFQIEFLALDESLLLPTEPDPLEKKNKELAAELNRYKSREPALAVLSNHYKNHLVSNSHLRPTSLTLNRRYRQNLQQGRRRCSQLSSGQNKN